MRTSDFYCGLLYGTATVGGVPIPIDGSTFGSIRIEEGTLGEALPEPVAECPMVVPDVDAGVPDASVPDAGAPDAGIPDAGAPDADPADAS